MLMNDAILEKWAKGKWWYVLLVDVIVLLRWTAILYFVHQFSRMIWWILLHPDEVASGPKTDSNYKSSPSDVSIAAEAVGEKRCRLGAHTASIYDHNAWMAGFNGYKCNNSER